MERYEALGGLLKRVGNFDNRSLETRVIFQKTVYFLQVFGLNFGYKFGYYIYGPYSTDLAKEGYLIEKIFDGLSPVQFTNRLNEEKFNIFQKFIASYAGDSKWLEAAASMHTLKKLSPKITKEELIQTIRNKQKYLDNEHFCNSIYDALVVANLI